MEPLINHLNRLTSDEFSELIPVFKPTMHTLLLVWKNSKFYNTPARLVVIMRELCNTLIAQACIYVASEPLFENTEEPEKKVESLKQCLKVCITFKTTYFDYKAKAASECPSNPWRFQNSALFARLDLFLERCHDVLDMMQTIMHFNRLGGDRGVEIGGTKGKDLTASVRQTHLDFEQALQVFRNATYEIMDVECKQFDADFYNFQSQIKELERRLASVITQAFDDSVTVLMRFKLLDSFEGMLEREVVQTDLEKKNSDLLNEYAADLKQVQEIFLLCSDMPPINDNAPPRAGAVTWCRALMERVQEPMDRFKGMSQQIMNGEEGKECLRAYSGILGQLQQYEQQHREEWAHEIDNTSAEKLKQSLLRKDAASGFMSVNFDPALVCLLRETKYFLLLNLEVPESAMSIFEMAETYRQQTGNLDLIVNIYNSILETVLDVERPLIQQKLDNIDKVLLKGQTRLNWKATGINEFIQQSMTLVKELKGQLTDMKSNVSKSQNTLKAWSDSLLIDRKPNKTYSVDEFVQTTNTLQATRKKAIERGSSELHTDIENSNKVLGVSKTKAEWQAYVDYVNGIIVEGLARVAVRSAQYLRDQLDKEEVTEKELSPLLEVAMKLAGKAAVFEPPLGKAGGKGISDLVMSWLEGFVNTSLLVARIDTVEEDGDYLLDLQEHPSVRLVTAQINHHLNISMADCEEFRQEYLRYEYLWQQKIEDVFQKFLAGEDPPPNHEWDKFEEGVTEPTLEAFERQIMKYKRLEEQVKDMPTSKVIGWLKVDAKQLKSSLATLISKWSFKFLEYLLEKVQHETEEITVFVEEVDQKLDIEVNNELEPLLEVMDNLTKIRKRTDATDAMFEPLRQTCTMLRKYNITIDDKVINDLESAPGKWNSLKKKSVLTKEMHSQAQTEEANKIKKQSKVFEERVADFFTNFKQVMPFQYMENYDEAYRMIDNMHHLPKSDENPFGSISELLADTKRLNELQELFELYVIEYREAAQCLKETIMLKELYDMISMVVDTFALWKKTKWDEIDVEFLGDASKVLAKNVKGMNKNLKNWPAYKGLEDAVKNMQTSLPLVEELHHPAMRDRHWKQLMRTCGVSFVMDENFTFGGLLALKLHEYEDDVMEIVDKAQKELTIEKQLAKIAETWKVQNLTFEPLADNPEMCLLKVEETVMECLEDSVVQMGNLQGSKYVQNNASFLEIVNGWQRKIGNVDSALSTWKEVQQKWNALQSIFIGSADIRVQLPEDSKRFDGIHADFGDLMKEASGLTNAVEACNLEGRIERLENMMEGLEKCEKALADYLETKRLAFPRFYFVAAADLLDILSKGSNPQLIVKHLPKCFDNIQSLEFRQNADGTPTKDAITMFSSEGEKVALHASFTCDGPVENWLFNLTTHSHECIKQLMWDATQVYEDKPKQEFQFDWCAMVAGTCSRMAYMEEVNITFDQIEEGNENAMREYNAKQVEQLTAFVQLVLGELTSNDRRKIVMIITVDVHARDVVEELIEAKAENNTHFTWMSQLKFQMDEKKHIVRIYICDYDCDFGYEYIGNCGCLVVTPLTDRCYITLTQAMRLILGGAPQGPAGTGKTETTKDLGRALGIMVYVFNCGDQMDYKACGQIFKGLSQAGAWGCFDEFNRINLDVLSVTSTQYKSVLDAIRKGGERFVFEDEEIPICSAPYCCAFITMNPGYAGRNELPESVKALFRPCAMVTPDMDLIAEIMLMSEGYAAGKLLARKFMMLYRLSEALLSPQRHYDWKLRAVKTTLCVAGGLRRLDLQTPEDRVLLRALRDFNIGKLVAEDVNIFMGMLNDLFPRALELVPRRRDMAFEEKIVEAAKQLNLQADLDSLFTLKCCQLREILVVRWSVFVVGPSGSGKSEMERTLSKAQNLNGEKSTINYLNPKGVDRNELYGYMHPATREWKDGLISQIFRDLANCETVKHEWIVLDGDIDAEWIESMNTVMDDNKMLTLASNERIPLTPPMRLLLEVENMREASPATVSRGGVIFLNDTDVGWAPYIASWIQQREMDSERQLLTKMFEDYGEKTFHHVHRNLKTIVPLPKINFAMSTVYILEGIFGNGEQFAQKMKQIGKEDGERLFEMFFMYAIVWAAGGSLTIDKSGDYKAQFDKWFRAEFPKIPYPEEGTVFNFVVNQETMEFEHWSKRIQPYQHVPGTVFGNLYVNSLETQQLTAILDLVVPYRRPVCFVGVAGTGKTTIMKDKLRHVDPEQFMSLGINFNSFTTSYVAQMAIESVLEKKTGKTFGPPGSRKMIYFIDDLNMPTVDKYGTQQPIALLRQAFDYEAWYDRVKLQPREMQKCQFLSCMNPTAGSFFIDPRLQKSYMNFAVMMPNNEVLKFIYKSILDGYLSQGFSAEVRNISETIVDATVDLYLQVAKYFLPTAIKFHYNFNLRETANIVQGISRATPAKAKTAVDAARLWYHECQRVIGDRLTTDDDQAKFLEMITATNKKWFGDIKDQDALNARPNYWTTFAVPGVDDTDRPYANINDINELTKVVEDRLHEYNENNAVMDLVMFDQAVEHVCRITRVIELPRGNALLVGVGGSGKQSLARLAAFIVGYESYQITVTSSYGMTDFKENLLTLYQKSGIKGIGIAFILTDGQIVKEQFLVLINDFLASGNIADLMPKDEKDNCCNAIRGEVKQAGLQDTADNCWDFFIEKVRKNLHMVLCFSPVGDSFRIRARQFPALVNDTVYDYFMGWSQDALMKVANRFIKEVEAISSVEGLQETVALHMSYVHRSVEEASTDFFNSERRYNYTTPKSFLDLITMYKTMLAQKKGDIHVLKERLENGLEKMNSAAEQVAELQENLVKDMEIVEAKKAATDELIVVVGQETAVAEEQKAAAAIEEEKCSAIAEEVMAFQAECDKDLEAAEPIIQEAEAALNTLDKKALTELKNLSSPPAGIDDVTAAVIWLTNKGQKPKDLSWAAAKKMMANIDQFLAMLINFDKDNTPDNACTWVEQNCITKPHFTVEVMKGKSSAAAGMTAWVINICKYFRIYQYVEPKRIKLLEANAKLDEANTKLTAVRQEVAELEEKLAKLTAQFEEATNEKNEAIAAAEKTQNKANMADRLVNGLADEKIRWTESIAGFEITEKNYVGDVMVASAFVSYIGAFSLPFRERLVDECWIKDMIERKMPMTDGVKPLDLLCDVAKVASWNTEGLPNDTVSVQNGAILTNCTRWPLMIDPQLQGVKWIKNRNVKQVEVAVATDEDGNVTETRMETKEMKVVQQTQGRYIDHVELAIQNGESIMIENLGENIDAVLDPVMMRAVIRRGRALVLKLGDKEVEYDPNFRLYLQTKLNNPHYKPEIAAQATLMNFMITMIGLEEQLLGLVVAKEREDLGMQKAQIIKDNNDFNIKLKQLEDDLLYNLSNSQGDILEDIGLIEGLEQSKKTSTEIKQKQALAAVTEKEIAAAMENYRPVAIRGAIVYFLVDQLWVLSHMYRFAMANFVTMFKKGMYNADVYEEGEEGAPEPVAEGEEKQAMTPAQLKARIERLIDKSCYTVFAFVAQGLFERHKLIFGSQLCFRVLARRGELDPRMFEFLIRCPKLNDMEITENLKDWLDASSWSAVCGLKEIAEPVNFSSLPSDMDQQAKRFKEWCELERPEDAGLPGEWKKMSAFAQLLIIRCLRTDRMGEALAQFVRKELGEKYVTSVPFNLKRAFEDANSLTPVFFILTPGFDPVPDVEAIGKEHGFSIEGGTIGLVSLGQGQEPVAEKIVEKASKNGEWGFLQNIHLTAGWTESYLEKRCESLDTAHEQFRLFLSGEPGIIPPLPINLLMICLKLNNEPPEGLKPNLLKAMYRFDDAFYENCSKVAELRSIAFMICFFHAIILERKKFGPQGWNVKYDFNTGDLSGACLVAMNYLEANTKIPWADLRYITGEILYGGHITNNFDRRLVDAYLQTYLNPELLDGFQVKE